MPICLSNKSQTRCSSDGCHENRFNSNYFYQIANGLKSALSRLASENVLDSARLWFKAASFAFLPLSFFISIVSYFSNTFLPVKHAGHNY